MRKNLFIIIIVLCITACKPKQLIQPTIEEKPFSAQADTSKIPEFPAEVIYILAREYEAIHNETTPKYNTQMAELIRKDSSSTMSHYLEKRLIQLYPNLAYKGMMKKITYISQNLIPEKRKKDFSRPTLEIDIKDEQEKNTIHPYISDNDEIRFLNMTDEETKLYRKLNLLADDSTFFSLNDLHHLSITDSSFHLKSQLLSDSVPFFLKENLTIPILLAGGGSYIFYRIMQSKARAEYVSEHLYPEKTKYGMQGDAFRHLFVNVMLKRYTTEALAWLIMDIYWEKVGNNAPCDLLMDLHNNNVGRSTQYQTFRGNNLYDWQQWAKNIKYFVDDTTKNATFKNWDRTTPLFIIRQEENNTDKKSYLYWKK